MSATAPADVKQGSEAGIVPAERPASHPGGWGFHAFLAGFFALVQVAHVPARPLRADNTWLFRLARDIGEGQPVYWSAVDPTRLLPDVLFGVVAGLLPGADDFDTWLAYFYSILVISLYASLAALAAVLFEDNRDRRAFLVLAVLAFCGVIAGLPLWGGWIMDPGNDGTALPVCFALLALLLRLSGPRRLEAGGLGLLSLAVALLVASNRVLLITFIVPAAISLLGIWTGFSQKEDTWKPALGLAAVTLVAGMAGYALRHAVDALGWIKVVMSQYGLGGATNPSFLRARLGREYWHLKETALPSLEILVGFAAIVLAAGLTALLVGRALRRRAVPERGRNLLVLGATASLSAAFAALVTVLAVEDQGELHYRLLVIPAAMALVFLVSLLSFDLLLKASGMSIGAVLLLVLALVMMKSTGRQYALIREDREMREGLDALAEMVKGHADPARVAGFADFWISTDATTHGQLLRIGALTEQLRYRFYNNNAFELCGARPSFILYDPRRDEPKRAAITSLLGEPKAIETVGLGRYERIEVLFYDPAILDEKIMSGAQREAAALFRDFRCPS